jgi:hypothetical protein
MRLTENYIPGKICKLYVVRRYLKKLTAAEKQKDKVEKTAYNPAVKDLLGSRPTFE